MVISYVGTILEHGVDDEKDISPDAIAAQDIRGLHPSLAAELLKIAAGILLLQTTQQETTWVDHELSKITSITTNGFWIKAWLVVGFHFAIALLIEKYSLPKLIESLQSDFLSAASGRKEKHMAFSKTVVSAVENRLLGVETAKDMYFGRVADVLCFEK